MKKSIVTVFTCTIMLCVLALCAVLTSCEDVSGKKPKPHVSMNGFIPDGIEDSDLSELPSDYQEEIRALYSCYWMDGPKDNCVKIDGDNLVIYSTAMSFSYENIRWARLSPSMLVCCAYHADEENYSEDGRSVILKFIKDAGGVKVWQRVVLMGLTSGPFTKDKEVESIVVKGKTFYVYDKNNPACPQMGEPESR